MTKIKITAYRAKLFGIYYKDKDKKPKNLYKNLTEVIEDLQSWINNKEIDDTKVQDENKDRGFFPVYTYSIDSIKEGFLITMWNQTPLTKGKVATLAKDGKVGKTKAKTTSTPKNSIPGFPTYFFISKSSPAVFSIKIEDGTKGTNEFSNYLKLFTTYFSKFAKIKYHNNNISDIEIDGYLNGKKIVKGNPKSWIQVQYRNTDWSELKKRYKDIYKLIKSSSITATKKTAKKNLLISILSDSGIERENYNFHNIKLKTEIDYVPANKNELETIKKKAEPKSNERVGFRLKKESDKIYWLDNIILSADIEVTGRKDNVIIERDFLLDCLKKKSFIYEINELIKKVGK